MRGDNRLKRLFLYLFLFLFIIFVPNTPVMAETKWITKKNSKISKVETIEQLYVDGLLTRGECIKTKEKILKGQSLPGCKIIKIEEETTTYITKKTDNKYITKKKEGKYTTKKTDIKYITKKKQGKYITKKKEGEYITKKEKKKNNTKILLLIPLYLFI